MDVFDALERKCISDIVPHCTCCITCGSFVVHLTQIRSECGMEDMSVGDAIRELYHRVHGGPRNHRRWHTTVLDISPTPYRRFSHTHASASQPFSYGTSPTSNFSPSLPHTSGPATTYRFLPTSTQSSSLYVEGSLATMRCLPCSLSSLPTSLTPGISRPSA